MKDVCAILGEPWGNTSKAGKWVDGVTGTYQMGGNGTRMISETWLPHAFARLGLDEDGRLWKWIEDNVLYSLSKAVVPAKPKTTLPATSETAKTKPVVIVEDGKVFATSKDVADFFSKEHANVLKAIDRLLDDDPEARVNFDEGCYTHERTGSQQHRQFNMDKDGFALLAMGFTGAKAAKFKRAYINAFNDALAEIERLRSQPSVPALPDFSSPSDAARAWAAEYDQKVIAQQEVKLLEGKVEEIVEKVDEANAKIAELEPKAAIGGRISNRKLRTILCPVIGSLWWGCSILSSGVPLSRNHWEPMSGAEKAHHNFVEAPRAHTVLFIGFLASLRAPAKQMSIPYSPKLGAKAGLSEWQ